MGSSKAPPPPPPPDYMALAKQQSADSQAQARLNAQLNRVDQVNPYGTMTYAQDPNNPDHWTQTESLNADAQATLQAQQQSQLALANAGQGMLGRATDAVSKPFSFDGMQDVGKLNMPQYPGSGDYGDYKNYDFSQLGDMPDAGFSAVQGVQDAMMNRLQPGMDQARNQEVNRLKAQGITEGSEAWNSSMNNLNRGDNDARQQALLGAMTASGDLFNRGMSVRQQGGAEMESGTDLANALRTQRRTEGLQDYGNQVNSQLTERSANLQDRQRQTEEALAMRQMPLNEFNSFMNGSQVQQPQFQSYATGFGGQNANILGASQAQYEDQIQRDNAAKAGRGNKTGSMAAGAASGATLGSTFGPYGTAIGGLIGGLGGYLGG